MADRAQQITFRHWIGIGAAASIPLLIGVTALAVVMSAEGGRGLSPADWAAIRFTLWQAVASAAISVVLAIPVARALARRRFPGRNALITLLGAPFLLPVIVAIFGLLAIFGRGGLLNAALTSFGADPISIYGYHGVILAHVFFNLPLATRLILQGWQPIPSERFRLASSLNLTPAAVTRHLELPMLARVIPGAALIIFVICTTSFAVALTLGGGPRATTVELAIYQALRFEFDLSRAALLSVIQLAITGTAAFVALKYVGNPGFGAGLDREMPRQTAPSTLRLLADATAITLATLFLITPLGAVIFSGLPFVTDLPTPVWTSALHSLTVALISTAIVIGLSLAMATTATRLGTKGRWIEVAGLTAIAASPLVLGTGLFVLIFPFADPSVMALPITALVNAIVTLPFALRVLIPALQAIEDDFGRLADSLRLTGWTRLRLLILPRLRRPLGFAAGIAAALSMGDLGVIALFADPETATLPLQIFRLMGAYRMDTAAGATVLLLVLSFGLFWAFDAGGRGRADS
ncbi:MAG: thiamine/thiamine pyrophosphate ABC transporter permease ThiP [Boseongicola sp.]|nr:MAG: thiamine/thiamine pyrophosphate ABC transporter permease ThiP [Boseongicola sp.]